MVSFCFLIIFLFAFLIFFKIDVITSIGAGTYSLEIRKQSINKDTLVLGTKNGLLLKVKLNNFTYSSLKYVYQYNSSLGPFLPNPAFDATTGNFYFLLKRGLTEISVVNCQVYTTCSACFRSKENCFWVQNQCRFRDSVKSLERFNNNKIFKQCPPEVYNFEPKESPKEGGTIITFYGNNLGSNSSENNKNVFLRITIGNKNCKPLEWENAKMSCRIENKNENNSKTGDKTNFYLIIFVIKILFVKMKEILPLMSVTLMQTTMKNVVGTTSKVVSHLKRSLLSSLLPCSVSTQCMVLLLVALA